MRVGILGGTFNPVHRGHLAVAEGALRVIPLDQVLWIPTHRPPHKAADPMAGPEERARMIELAIQGNRAFRLSRVELDRPPPSYTIDTVRRLQEQSKDPKTEWFFLVGSDSARQLNTWRAIDELLTLVQFVVIPRPGVPPHSYPPGVREIPVEAPDLCSCEIRKRIQEGQSIRGLVPEAVLTYIKEHGLYQ